jgi:hypothetical protein
MTEDDEARLREDPPRRAAPRGLAIVIAVALAVVAGGERRYLRGG